MKYSKYTPEQQEILAKSDGLYTQGHTDLGTLTLLFRQPVAALQIKDHKTGEWKWAKPLDGSLTVNTCDALSFLTGNYIKSTIHRVCSPYPLAPLPSGLFLVVTKLSTPPGLVSSVLTRLSGISPAQGSTKCR